jgi:hypothetical protein
VEREPLINTVLNRLARIEQLTGTSLLNKQDIVLLAAAVQVAQLLPVDAPAGALSEAGGAGHRSTEPRPPG